MFYKVKSVQALENLQLLIQFENSTQKIYNIQRLLLKYKNFEALKDTALFNQVKVDSHGYGIYWNGYLDIGCNELWHNGKEVSHSIV